MRHPKIHFVIVAVALSLGISVAAAEESVPRAAVLYRLEPGSTLQQGCFPPCMCPLMQETPLRGTFRLVRTETDWLFDYYDVSDVRWKSIVGGAATTITGSGTYLRGGEVAVEHRLELDLALGAAVRQHFSSGAGRLLANPGFPRIAISVSIHGGFCFDTVLRLDALPARRLHVGRDGLFWDPEPTSAAYDVVAGDLNALRENGGEFDLATTACVGAGLAETAVLFGDEPEAGSAFWFLVRREGDSYDDADASQVGSADAGIAASPGVCP